MQREHRIPRMRTAPVRRALLAPLFILALAALAAACGEDPTPTPTATPTPTPEPLDTLVLSASLTGEDFTDRLSADENACLRSAMGGAEYAAFQSGPFVQEVGAAYEHPVIERSLMNTLFNCLSDENVPVLGSMVMSAHGDWPDEISDCVSGIAGEHTEVAYIWLGLEREPDPATAEHAASNHLFLLDIWECFTDKEKVEFTLHSWSTSEGATGEELVTEVLEPEELACLTENLPESSFAMLRNLSSLSEALTIPDIAAALICIGPDLNNRLFIAGFAKRTGGLTDESAACVLQFTLEHPHYMELAQNSDFDPSTMPEAELAEIATDSGLMFDCLTEEELGSYQKSFSERWYAP